MEAACTFLHTYPVLLFYLALPELYHFLITSNLVNELFSWVL